jgi:hypothetical protein
MTVSVEITPRGIDRVVVTTRDVRESQRANLFLAEAAPVLEKLHQGLRELPKSSK